MLSAVTKGKKLLKEQREGKLTSAKKAAPTLRDAGVHWGPTKEKYSRWRQ